MMSVLTKLLLLVAKDKRFWNAVLAVIVGSILFISLTFYYVSETTQGSSSALADQALAEYEHWEEHSPSESGFSCQGEKYCSHFNYPTVDWCCIFVGYCADEVSLDLDEIGFSVNTGVWKNNLIELGEYQDPDTYQPRRGNVVLFDYSGRAHHDATGDTQHIGIVVEVSDDGSTITVVAGNENGSDATNSIIQKYELSATDNSIACYGSIGADVTVTANSTNTLVREVITHNEIGVLYSELDDEYGSVIPCDVNAISVGVYGWHGDKALELLKLAYSKNPMEVRAVCSSYGQKGIRLENTIITGASWSSYVPDTTTVNCIRAILLTDSGKAAQDETSLIDAQKYIDICTENGIVDYKCVTYCSDILNQWGIHSFDGGCLSSITGSMSLSDIYNSRVAWADSNYNYYNRRTWTYNYVKDYTLTQ